MNLQTTISIHAGGAGSGCNPAAGTCGRKSSGGSVYHVTHTNLVPKIQKEGLKPMQTSNWVKQGDKSRYGKGEINTFSNAHDALRWAAKMDWAFNQATGSGKVSILKLSRGDEDWKQDKESDPLGQASSKGQWLKYQGGIPPDRIQTVHQFKSDDVPYLVHGNKEFKL